MMEHISVEALPPGGLEQHIRDMGYVDADEAAELGTLRAASYGIYHLYTRTSVNKWVHNKQVERKAFLGGANYYKKDDILAVSIKPKRARPPKTPTQLRTEIAWYTERIQSILSDENLSKKTKMGSALRTELRKLRNATRKLQKILPLADEAEQIVKQYWEDQEASVAQIREKQDEQEPPPMVANV